MTTSRDPAGTQTGEPSASELRPFLESSSIIDFDNELVRTRAAQLRDEDKTTTTKRCFEFVRDEVLHSWDAQQNPVTLNASQVLTHRTGYCYAKSHLLAALLRANNIPVGFCYQRLTSYEPGDYCLHGLNAIYLAEFGWYRVDARGNKQEVDAQFCPPVERLAFELIDDGEMDLPEILPSPLPEVVNCLTRFSTWDEVAANLPDLDIEHGN